MWYTGVSSCPCTVIHDLCRLMIMSEVMSLLEAKERFEPVVWVVWGVGIYEPICSAILQWWLIMFYIIITVNYSGYMGHVEYILEKTEQIMFFIGQQKQKKGGGVCCGLWQKKIHVNLSEYAPYVDNSIYQQITIFSLTMLPTHNCLRSELNTTKKVVWASRHQNTL